MKTNRNEPCLCGSGKKYKRCCGDAVDRRPASATRIGAGIASNAAAIPTIVNADGHLTVYTTSLYEVGDPETVLAEVSRWRPKPDERVSRSGGGRIESFEADFQRRTLGRGHPGDRVLVARLAWRDGDHLVVETNSTERDLEIRDRLSLLPPSDLRLLRTEGRSAYAAVTEPRSEQAERRSREEEAQLRRNPEAQAMLAQIMSDYSKRWCDEVIPALGNRRPRTLVKTAAGRARVIALIEQFEMRPRRPAGTGSMDFPLIRKELGLPPR